ncbi:hypothetical protein EZH22_16025 [Xanthobacter dioxanivorans]|uniref:Uncharacterized protein n=1 Tax=Xanthobacter dioxanivorans TaxID=2528964 RepID=A0A974PJ98_9HYPH|nr:hypothetical protein [Xanthobacter dioxanivorans]QRG04677.1 hypothetical protein EZH22_16025 [Xanthobacter dioxanivorans]
MNTRLKLLTTFGTLALVGMGIVGNAYADETVTKENMEQEQFFQKYGNETSPALFFNEAAPAVRVPAGLRKLPASSSIPTFAGAQDPHWGAAQDATDGAAD